MNRGEVWTVSGGGDDSGKPRPAVVLQDGRFDSTASVTVCALTTNPADVPLVRPLIEPNERKGLREPSRMMVDKITTVARRKIGVQLGRLDDLDIVRLNRALLVFLGMAGPWVHLDEGGT